MRPNRGLLIGVLGCLTIFFIALNSKSIVEITDSSEVDFEKHRVGEREISSVQIYRYVTPSLAELGSRGNLPKMNEHILMLTRVPDAGSELLILILQRLQGYNAFKHIRLPPGDYGLLSSLQEELLVEEITSIIKQEAIPLTFDGDVKFLNFSKYGRQAPTFFSIVRNPVHSRNVERYLESPKRDFVGGAIPHFCGQDHRCKKKNSKWALQRAKANVVEWYPVVGVLDCMEQSLNALEKVFPYFFNGAIRTYKKIRLKYKYLSSTAIQLKPQEEEIFKNLLADEIEFYQWLKHRLLNQTFDN